MGISSRVHLQHTSSVSRLSTVSIMGKQYPVVKLISSKGIVRRNVAGRYLEVLEFPSPGSPGSGQYVKDGRIVSEFTFQGGENGVFDASQQNGRPFHLAPILDGDTPVGFLWTMREEYPLFEVHFRLRSPVGSQRRPRG